MGIPLKFLNPSNYMNMVRFAKITDSLGKHMKRRCAYCDLDLGSGDDVPIVSFVEHLIMNHPEKIDSNDVEHYKNIIDKITK